MASSTQAQFIANRYEIRDIVGRGGMGVVYRCYDHVTHTDVALKQMHVSMKQDDSTIQDSPIEKGNTSHTGKLDTISVASPDTWRRDSPFVGMVQSDTNPGAIRLELSHEFETLARLRHPNIITVLDYGFDSLKLPFFTMPLLKAPKPISEAKDATLDSKIIWLAEMLQALAYLHHHKIIHRDLKPDNALLTDEDSVKLLDFGLAVIRKRTDSFNDNDQEMVSGTIPYMAPELIQGGSPSTSSDLYAFGMIAYELLAGRYPFEFDGIAALIMRILTEVPSVDELDVATPIQEWLDDLLQIEPQERSQDALDVLKRLSEITTVKISVETKSIQESYLQTASFVGRDEELKTLLEGLRSAISSDGSSWLIIGESGFGKSRLISELRILAQVNGFQVLQGHGSQGSLTPYQILREPLKRLLLSTPVDATEANILKILLPDLETILGRKIPEVLQDEVSHYGSQLSGVILKLFQQQVKPTLLILDDLHRASESVEILSNLVATVPQSKLMIVATQRPNNIIDVAGDLAEMTHLHLKRLTDSDVATLARSILGDIGLRADIQEILKEEARGNVNFLLEVIRALLEQVQHLRDIAMMRVPEEISAGGINQVLAQRLAKISGQTRHLFNLIAVAGLEIDRNLLNHLADPLEISSEDWLGTLSNHVIIEREGEVWQITHERLRLVALDQISGDELPQLHSRVAQALEELYPDTVEKAGMIAYHWQQAGDEEREHHYLLDAADYALRLNSFQDAVRLYRRALELQVKVDKGETDSARIQLKLGESLMYVGEYDDARDYLQNGLDGIDETAHSDRAKALLLLSDVFWRAGQFDDARDSGTQSLELARKISQREIEIHCLSRLGMIAVNKGDYSSAETFYEEGLALAEEKQDEVGMTMLNNNYGILAGTRGDFDKAIERFEASMGLSDRNNWDYRTVSTLINLGSIAGMRGDLEAAASYFERSLIMARAVGDRRHIGIALENLGEVAQLREEYQKARQYLEESLALARTIGNRAYVPVVLQKLAIVFEKLGDFESAQEYLINAIEQAKEIQAVPASLMAIAELARIEPDAEQAVQWAEFVITHEAAGHEASEIATKIIEKWTSLLDEEIVAKYREGASDLTLDTILD